MHNDTFNSMHYALCIFVKFIVGTTLGDPKVYALPNICIMTLCIMTNCTVLRKNGIEPFSQLKQQDAALADATPNVTSARFAVLFGGLPLHERPCSRVRNILCIDRVVQPYAPSSPGESGVIFFTPGTILFEDNYPSFHMFLNISPQTTYRTKRKFCYLGAYCKVPSTSQTVEVEEWLSLPIMVSTISLSSCSHLHTQCGRILRQGHFSDFFPPLLLLQCRASWSWRIHSTKVPGVRAIHARISIRNGRPHGPPPSQDEVEEWLKNHPERRDGLGDGNIVNAFNKGEEVRLELFSLFLIP
jgi:hypothetical protein